jgi:cytochrome c-type biogenesis protein CcsB
MLLRTELIFFWITVIFYAASFCQLTAAAVFERPQWTRGGVVLAIGGLVTHSAAIILRWIAVGHGPYINLYEIASSETWFAVAAYLLLYRKYPNLYLVGSFIMPISFLLIGFGMFGTKQANPIPDTFYTFWLIVHILFAKLTYGSCLVAAGIGGMYLVKEKWPEKLVNLPDLAKLDLLGYRFIAFGFIMAAVMIFAGSIWANEAWGRYWGWDPIETWSLISWLVYAIYLHRRVTGRWEGRKAAWMAIGAVFVLIFALFGVNFVYQSVHSGYMKI